jgi:ParB family transcriptional regulator, chromosome partitioning protein
MPGTSNAAAADKAGIKTGSEKGHEKVMEKRRALGRGLDSLLPGPRVVAPPVVPAPPAQTQRTDESEPTRAQAERGDESAGAGEAAAALRMTTIPGLQAAEGSDGGAASDASAEFHSAGQPGAAVPTSAVPTPAVTLRPGGGDEVVRLAIDSIDRNPHQTRMKFAEEALKELAQSILEQGVLQPVVVRANGEGHYTLILGERRLRASALAGIETIPAIVKRVSEQQAAEMTLVENLQRQDLNCVEQAWAFSNLSKEFNLTQEEIGKRVGLSREAVSNYMRLLALPEGVHEALIGGRLTYSHARLLLSLPDKPAQWTMAKRAMTEKMSVARLEDVVMGHSTPGQFGNLDKPAGGARWVDPNVKAAQRSLEEVLGMRVRIRDRRGRGKIVIEYASIMDFDRVVEMLRGK